MAIGIVYSKSQQIIRRIIKANDLTPHKDIHPNESWAEIDEAIYGNFKSHQEIHDHLGLKGISGHHDRHAVVDENGHVHAVILADPAIDAHSKGKLVHHLTAVAGDKIP